MTRAQWEEMWENAKRLETIVDSLRKNRLHNRAKAIEEEVKNIKRLIQSEIGQME